MINKINKVNVNKSRETLQNVSKAVSVGLAALIVVEYLQQRKKK